MDWDRMIKREPELHHVKDSCRRAKRQGADWHDFWATHHVELGRLVGANSRCPGLRFDSYYQTAPVQLLIAVCRELARENEGRPFFLSVRRAAEVMAVIPMQGSRTLHGLERDGVLECLEKGEYKTRRASTWRYLPPLND